MKTFLNYIIEARGPASSVDEEELTHLTHAKELHYSDPSHAKTGLDLIKQFHNHRQGKPSTIKASLKTDGGASVHIIHDEHGVGVTDKHRWARGIVARTPQEVDQHFGHAPEYAASMKHLLAHGHEFVNKGHHVQGDLLHTPKDKVESKAGKISITPNRITYKAKTKAPLGVAIHTEIHGRTAKALSKGALRHSDHVFVPEAEYKSHPESYSKTDRDATEHHLAAAEKLLKGHSTKHLTPEHVAHFTTYMNSTTRNNTLPTVEGYKKHLQAVGEKKASKLKTASAQQRVRDQHAAMISHIDKHAEHFQKSIDIHHHLEQATEHVLKGVEHPDMETSIDGKKSQGEGVVLQRNGRPVAKLVPRKVSTAILNNPRFGRG
jgi:hypothetical protein